MRGIAYARYSPRRGKSDSIRSQFEDLNKALPNYQIAPELYFFDRETSGTLDLFARQGLSEAVGALRRGDVLCVRNLNRLARDAIVGIAIERQLRRMGCHLFSLEDGGLLSWDRQQRLIRGMLYLMADYQREETNERTSRKMREHQRNGRAMGSQAPFGQQIVAGSLVRDPRECLILELMAKLTSQGANCALIAARLNEVDIRKRNGKDWDAASVSNIIRRKSCQSST